VARGAGGSGSSTPRGSDADLAFVAGEDGPPAGDLCREQLSARDREGKRKGESKKGKENGCREGRNWTQGRYAADQQACDNWATGEGSLCHAFAFIDTVPSPKILIVIYAASKRVP
jgi:hypothetical protein